MNEKQEPGDEISEIFLLIEELTKETTVCRKLVEQEDTQLHRRMFVRALFAEVEGITYSLKQATLKLGLWKYNGTLSIPELLILSDDAYELDDKGEVKARPAKIQTLKNIRFAFKTYAKANYSNYDLAVNSSGWESFKVTLKVRDRLMHPKRLFDLSITDDEMSKADLAMKWFAESLYELTQECQKGIQDQEQ